MAVLGLSKQKGDKMELRPLTAEQVSKLFTLEELTALGQTPNSEIFGRILTKAVVAQRDQDQQIMTGLYEACKAQHDAIDILFARLIELDKTFFPSKSGKPWEAAVQGFKAIAKAEDT